MAVAGDVVDAPDRRPVLVLAQRLQRKKRLRLRIRPRPDAREQQVMGVGGRRSALMFLASGPNPTFEQECPPCPDLLLYPPGADVISEYAYGLQLIRKRH